MKINDMYIRLFFIFMFVASGARNLYAQSDNDIDIIENWRKTLRYGTEQEIVELIPTLITERVGVAHPEMSALLSTHFSDDLKREVVRYFRQLEIYTIGEQLLAYTDPNTTAEKMILEVLAYYTSAPPSTINSTIHDRLLALSAESNTIVARAAIDALAIHGNEHAVVIMSEKIGNDELPDDIRAGAMRVVGKHGYLAAGDNLIAILDNERASPYLRRSAVSAIGYLGDPRYIEQLRRYAQDNDTLLRAAIITALVGNNSVEHADIISSALRDSHYTIRLSVLNGIDTDIPNDTLFSLIAYRALNDANKDVMLAAIKTLAVYGKTKGRDFLLTNMRNNALPVDARAHIALHLTERYYAYSKEEILALINEEHAIRRPYFLPSYARKLSTIDIPHTRDIHNALLNSDEPEVLIYTLQSIARSNIHSLAENIQLLKQQNSSSDIQFHASATLQRINR